MNWIIEDTQKEKKMKTGKSTQALTGKQKTRAHRTAYLKGISCRSKVSACSKSHKTPHIRKHKWHFNGGKQRFSEESQKSHTDITVPTFSQLCRGRGDRAQRGEEKWERKGRLENTRGDTERKQVRLRNVARWQQAEVQAKKESKKERKKDTLLMTVSINGLSNTHWTALQNSGRSFWFMFMSECVHCILYSRSYMGAHVCVWQRCPLMCNPLCMCVHLLEWFIFWVDRQHSKRPWE